MPSEQHSVVNFGHAAQGQSEYIRPETEQDCLNALNPIALPRGNGLSYSDCSLNDNGTLIDTSRLNHFISFDQNTGILICQPHILIADLFLIDAEFIPPVIPGTIQATLGGAIANDIHGKNNPSFGTISHHIIWLEVVIGQQCLRCSPEENSDLFFATIGGLGLTGIITRIAIRLRKTGRMVSVQSKKINSWSSLLTQMSSSTHHDYQVAWLNLSNPHQSILLAANHEACPVLHSLKNISLPRLPFKLINKLTSRAYNFFYYHQASKHPALQLLTRFNNPLDNVKNWPYLYGSSGLLQFQAVFSEQNALSLIEKIHHLIKNAHACPVLTVLKYFTESGLGLLSFAQKGFTLAIDFPNNRLSRELILALNQLITDEKGKIYLAKDLLLTPQQFRLQYPQIELFQEIRARYACKITSNLSRRLEIV